MEKKIKNDKYSRRLQYNIATNIVLGVLVLSVGALCLSPVEPLAKTSGEETEMERLICSQYLPSYGEEGLRQALASSEDYASFKRVILHTIKQ